MNEDSCHQKNYKYENVTTITDIITVDPSMIMLKFYYYLIDQVHLQFCDKGALRFISSNHKPNRILLVKSEL